MADKKMKVGVVFDTVEKPLKFGGSGDYFLYFCQDRESGKLHIVEDTDCWQETYVCGIIASSRVRGNNMGIKPLLVEPKDVMPALVPTDEDMKQHIMDAMAHSLPVSIPAFKLGVAKEQLKRVLCGNCWRRINGKNWSQDEDSLDNMLEKLYLKYYEKTFPTGTLGLSKTDTNINIGTKCTKETDMEQNVVTLVLEVEFDLNDECPKEVIDTIEDIKNEADSKGCVTSCKVTSGPLDFQIDV